ncbi:STAS domain-containing protein [Lentzea sp. NPDC051838]|uniref:STAS domain-containing protein n=1 Tax=Lentzea sp. NPDC051838 TaxID=3154849 RepID=UPI003416202B
MPTENVVLRTTIESVGGVVVVHVAGEVDRVTADDLSGCLAGALGSAHPPAPVVVDLSEVNFLGACGIGLLLDHQDRCLSRGSALVLVARTPEVLRPLQVLELTSVLDVRPSLVDALAVPGLA